MLQSTDNLLSKLCFYGRYTETFVHDFGLSLNQQITA